MAYDGERLSCHKCDTEYFLPQALLAGPNRGARTAECPHSKKPYKTLVPNKASVSQQEKKP
jgi:hypothetical protein